MQTCIILNRLFHISVFIAFSFKNIILVLFSTASSSEQNRLKSTELPHARCLHSHFQVGDVLAQSITLQGHAAISLRWDLLNGDLSGAGTHTQRVM